MYNNNPRICTTSIVMAVVFNVFLLINTTPFVQSSSFVSTFNRYTNTVKHIVSTVNGNHSHLWQAGFSKFDHWSNRAIEEMLGVSPLHVLSKMEKAGRKRNERKLVMAQGSHLARSFATPTSDLPVDFDPREKWPECSKSLNEIRDQGSCGSCWAFGAVEAMTDRICISSKGKEKFHLSAQDLVACCSTCGFGCFGGFPEAAWQYWIRKGIVTGGNYNTSEGCIPYSIPACEHHANGTRPPCGEIVSTPKCLHKCTVPRYNREDSIEYEKDRHFGQGTVGTSCFEEEIKKELFENGPIEAAMLVYDDFLNYRSGVYHHVTGPMLGGHAIKLMGWGVDKHTNERYWLAANSWNTDWGENGFFRIRRGKDECGIESEVVFAQPLLSTIESDNKEDVTSSILNSLQLYSLFERCYPRKFMPYTRIVLFGLWIFCPFVFLLLLLFRRWSPVPKHPLSLNVYKITEKRGYSRIP